MRPHQKGEFCTECCCLGPHNCEVKNCTGFVHERVVDETEDSDGMYNYIHNYKCDACGLENYWDADFPLKFESPPQKEET